MGYVGSSCLPARRAAPAVLAQGSVVALVALSRGINTAAFHSHTLFARLRSFWLQQLARVFGILTFGFWLLAFGSRLSWLLHFLPVVLLLRVTVHVNIQVASQLCHDYDANSSSGTSFSVRLVFGISARRLVGHRVWGFGVSISSAHKRKTTSECRLHIP
jgi:hypothetical protein